MSRKNRRLEAIAKIIGAEGFTDFAANEVKRYWRRRVITPDGRKRVGKIRRAFGEVAARLPAGDQLILGKYISILCKEQFETGLRLGLMTLVADLSEEAHWDDMETGAGLIE